MGFFQATKGKRHKAAVKRSQHNTAEDRRMRAVKRQRSQARRVRKGMTNG